MSLLILALLAGCTSRPQPSNPQPRRAVFNESEYSPYSRPGKGTVVGQAFMKTRGGDVKYGAGNEVILNPVTSYSIEWWTRSVLAQEDLGAGDARAKQFQRIAIADGSGRFRFDGLPPGEYYIVTSVYWEYYEGGQGLRRTGGLVGQRFRLSDGQQRDLILTSLDAINIH